MRKFRLKPSLSLSTNIAWLKPGTVFEGDYVLMKDRVVRLLPPDRAPAIEVPSGWLDEVVEE